MSFFVITEACVCPSVPQQCQSLIKLQSGAGSQSQAMLNMCWWRVTALQIRVRGWTATLSPRKQHSSVSTMCLLKHATHETAIVLWGLRCEEITFWVKTVLLFKRASQYSHILNRFLSEDTETGAPITTHRSVFSLCHGLRQPSSPGLCGCVCKCVLG